MITVEPRNELSTDTKDYEIVRVWHENTHRSFSVATTQVYMYVYAMTHKDLKGKYFAKMVIIQVALTLCI